MTPTQSPLLVDHGPVHLAAATGHAHLQAAHHTEARTALTAALDQLPPTARRSRILTLTDLAMTELHAGNLSDACRHAITAADCCPSLILSMMSSSVLPMMGV